jgi:hypothetical protein
LHETTSEVVNPLAGKINVNFLLNVLQSVFLNNRKNSLHSLFSLLLFLVFDQLTIELNFCVLRTESFGQCVESWRLEQLLFFFRNALNRSSYVFLVHETLKLCFELLTSRR